MKLLKILSLAALVLLLTQCYPEGPMAGDELDLVYSNYDPEYNFAAKKTFALPPNILKITDDLLTGGDPSYVKEPYASTMLGLISQNMISYGWQKVDIAEDPDVLLAPAAVEVTTTYYYDYWGYYGGWYGGYYPPYGGWYYPYPATSSYSTGSLIVAMVDPNDVSVDDKQRVVWTFIINGIMTGQTSTFNSRVTKGINQAFTQSQYIKK